MDDAQALHKLKRTLELIKGPGHPFAAISVALVATLGPGELEDAIREGVRFARDLANHESEPHLAARLVVDPENSEGTPRWSQARGAIVELSTMLRHRDELAAMTRPSGPQLRTQALHPTLWNAVAALWNDGHHQQAVQAAAQALEGLLQTHAGPSVSGEKLAALFSSSDPAPNAPRLRIKGLDVESPTGKSAHAAGLVRGAMMAVRNLVSHPGWPVPDENEALEMLAVLSYVAHFTDRCDLVTL